MGSLFSPKKPDMAAAQARAAEQERERLAREEEAKKAQSEMERTKAMEESEAKRRALIGGLQEAGAEPTRRRFLKAV